MMQQRVTIDIALLQGEPLDIHPFLGEDHVAEIGGLRAGWILAGTPADSGRVWLWTLTGPSCGTARVNTVGGCSSLGEAKAELLGAFEQWKSWAITTPQQAVWFG